VNEWDGRVWVSGWLVSGWWLGGGLVVGGWRVSWWVCGWVSERVVDVWDGGGLWAVSGKVGGYVGGGWVRWCGG